MVPKRAQTPRSPNTQPLAGSSEPELHFHLRKKKKGDTTSAQNRAPRREVGSTALSRKDGPPGRARRRGPVPAGRVGKRTGAGSPSEQGVDRPADRRGGGKTERTEPGHRRSSLSRRFTFTYHRLSSHGDGPSRACALRPHAATPPRLAAIFPRARREM